MKGGKGMIEKMELLSLVGAKSACHDMLEVLVLCEKIHMDLEPSFDNNYIMHEYDTSLPLASQNVEDHSEETEQICQNGVAEIEKIMEQLELELTFKVKDIKKYSFQLALEDLHDVQTHIVPNIETITKKRQDLRDAKEVQKLLGYIEKDVDFTGLRELEYIRYEIGTMSKESSMHMKKNYENMGAIAFKIGNITDSKEDIYMLFYLTELEEETKRILKSLNWHALDIGENLTGDIETCKAANEKRIDILQKQIDILEKGLFATKEDLLNKLSKIYTRLKLELKIIELKKQTLVGNNVFILNAWIREVDYDVIKGLISCVTDKYVMTTQTPDDLSGTVRPPTLLNNRWFSKPFEMIVELYGLPRYDEIDPTPFLAVTFCLMFGIMFGDIGQGFVYLLAGILLTSRMPNAGGILTRLGGTSMIFGVIYGSFFGLEDIEWLKNIALVHGGPLNTRNIMPILIAGVAFGVVVLTISFGLGIVNALRRHDVESAFFGKNGVAGYLFFIGLIAAVLSIMNVIPISISSCAMLMVLMLIIMIFKEPLIHLLEGHRPLITGDKSSYYIESCFEGIETILSTLSNSISFIRVGAFALNHAGLFMAFKVMSEMVPSGLLAFFILVLGNVLILVLEGLVVFIQGLRLQYYEMFSKYFGGDGIAYQPLKLDKE